MRGTKRTFEDVSGDATEITMLAKAFKRHIECDTMNIRYENEHCYLPQIVRVPCPHQPQTGPVSVELFRVALQKYADDVCTGDTHPNPQNQDCVFLYIHTDDNKEPVIIECLKESNEKSAQWVCYDHPSGCCIKVADLSKHLEVFLKPLDEVFNMKSFTVKNANQVKGITAIGLYTCPGLSAEVKDAQGNPIRPATGHTAIGLYTCHGLSAEVKDAQGNPIRPANGHKVRVSAKRNDPSNDQMEERPNLPVSTSRGPMIKVEYTCTPVNATEPCKYEGWAYLRHLR